MRRFMRFLAGDSGNVAIIFGIVAIPVFAMMGAAVDYNRAASSREKLNSALDSATLALGRQQMMTDAEAVTFLENYLATQLAAVNYHGTWEIVDGSFRQDRRGVEVAAAGVVPTSIMGVLNIHQIPIAAATEVVREQKKLELALALDSTGSMESGNRMGALRNAATSLVDIINEREDAEENVRIAVVPFVTGVNIRREPYFSGDWIDTEARAHWHGRNFDPSVSEHGPGIPPDDPTWDGIVGASGNVNHLRLFDILEGYNANWGWAGCVEARPGDLAIDDTPPDPSNPDTLFVPWFWPDDPDHSSYQAQHGNDTQRRDLYSNNYLPDLIDHWETDPIRQQQFVGKYVDPPHGDIDIANLPNPWSQWTRGPNRSCARPLLPLTDNMNLVKTEINAMEAFHNSGTNVPEGLAWGWRVLSPGEPFGQGVPYDNTDVLKALVLLTDGQNEVYGAWNTPHGSHYGSYGYVHQGRLDEITTRSQATARWNQRTATLCQRVKAQNIRLYTITFQLNDTATQNLFRDCATETRLYYNSPNNAELQQAFEDIAYDLSNLRISK